MDLTSITVSNFKEQFPRDFPFLRAWSTSKTYSIDDEVSYNDAIYRALAETTGDKPSSSEDVWREIEEYESNYVLDSDITRSFSETQITFNQGLFGTDAQIQIGYLYLTAHYLVLNIKAALKGVQGNGEFVVNSRSVGSVSENFTVPEWITKDRILGAFAQTAYGLKYLNMISSSLVGNIVAIGGATLP